MKYKFFTFSVTFTILLFCAFTTTYAQIEISGQIIDEDELPLPGVNVVIKGTSQGTITDLTGNYTVSVADTSQILVFSYIGYLTQEIAVGNQKKINLTLRPDNQNLEEIVVVGYGTKKKSDITGSVTSVSMENIENIPNLSIDQGMQGRAAGVHITQNSGAPGSGSTIRIRGMGSTTSTSPLYVIDGQIMGGNADFLSPNDIKSVEILKDASAQAIYGSRAANGVILITTKQGKEGKSTLAFNYYTGVQQMQREIDVMDAPQFAKMYNRIMELRRRPPYFPHPDTMALEYDTLYPYNTNWQEEIQQTAPVSNYNLTYSGGNDKSTFLVSANYFSQKGIIKESQFNRLTFRINSSHKINNRIKLSQNLSLVNYKRSRIFENQEYLSPLASAIKYHPFVPVRDEEMYPNSTNNWGFSPLSGGGANPVAMTQIRDENFMSSNAFGNIDLGIEILPGLMFNSNIGTNLLFFESNLFVPEYTITASDMNPNPTLRETTKKSFSWQWYNTLSYDKTFGEHHNINILAGTEAHHSQTSSIRGEGVLLSENENLRYLSLIEAGTANVEGSGSNHAIASYMARMNYNYDGKYFATATYRRDGSSRFGANNKWGDFYSGSLMWKFSEEEFIKQIAWLSFGKLRLSYGEVGNESIPDFAYLATIDYNSDRWYVLGIPQAKFVGAGASSVANPEITWESVISQNLGIDIGFLENRFYLSFDVYKKFSDGLLLQKPLPGIAGQYIEHTPWERDISYPIINIGEVVNNGFEVVFSYKNRDHQLKYSFDVNFSRYVNELTSLGGGLPIYGPQFDQFASFNIADEGLPIGTFIGYETAGLFSENDAEMIDGDLVVTNQPYTVNDDGEKEYAQPNAQPGDFRFVDQNRDGVIDNEDKTEIGNPHPDFTAGFSGNLEYKGFDLAFQFYMVYGNDIFDGAKLFYFNQSGDVNWHVDMQNAYRSPEYDDEGNVIDAGNTNTDIPRLDPRSVNGNLTKVSDFFIEDGSFIRMKNLQLGYTFPESIINKINIKHLRMYVSAQNLFTITNYKYGFDPEIGSGENGTLDFGIDRVSYPVPRVFTIGFNLSF